MKGAVSVLFCGLMLGVLAFVVPAATEKLTVGGQDLMGQLLYKEDFSSGMNRWRVEGRGRVWVEDGRLQMDASGKESTAWFKPDMSGNLYIRYEAQVLDPVDANNINFFFLATAPGGGDVLKLPFSGAYTEYHKVPNYIMTFTDGYTRFRRDPGFNLVSERTDIRADAHVLYTIEVLAIDNSIRCFINGAEAHSYDDPNRYRSGKLAFRSWHTRLWWDNLRVYEILK
jgi:hypothetical protein